MALIKCPECNKEVSDKSEICIHCGYPIQEYIEEQNTEPSETGMNICPCCGKVYYGDPLKRFPKSQFPKPESNTCTKCNTKLVNAHFNGGLGKMSIDEEMKLTKKWREKYVVNSPLFNEELYNQTLQSDKELYEHRAMNQRLASQLPKCPTCGSTSIQCIGAGEKVVSGALWGLFSNKVHKTYKCNNCKYMW